MTDEASEGKGTPSAAEIEEEARRARRLQIVVGLALNLIAQGAASLAVANDLLAATRRIALQLFPDKGDTFDLIYRPRFQRLMKEVYQRNADLQKMPAQMQMLKIPKTCGRCINPSL